VPDLVALLERAQSPDVAGELDRQMPPDNLHNDGIISG
jgi:hypothetical protein